MWSSVLPWTRPQPSPASLSHSHTSKTVPSECGCSGSQRKGRGEKQGGCPAIYTFPRVSPGPTDSAVSRSASPTSSQFSGGKGAFRQDQEGMDGLGRGKRKSQQPKRRPRLVGACQRAPSSSLLPQAGLQQSQGHPVQGESQINNEQTCSVTMFQILMSVL